MWGNAKGRSINLHLCIFDTPDIDPASCKDGGTLLKPSTVYLVAGTLAYTIAAIITEVSVMPNRSMTGIRYINDGNVWKKSHSDKIDLLANSFWAHKDPTTIPEIADTPTANVAIYRVIRVLSQYSESAMKSMRLPTIRQDLIPPII